MSTGSGRSSVWKYGFKNSNNTALNILFLADPNSIHDIKWMSYFSREHKCFLLARKQHAEKLGPENFDKFESEFNIKILGSIEDFSIRNFLGTIAQYRIIKKLIKEENIDLMHIMYAEPNALWAFFRSNVNIPILLTTRGTDVLKTIPEFFEGSGLLNRMVAYLYRKSFIKTDSITCTSIRQKASVLKLTGAKVKSPHIIRTGVDIQSILSDTASYKKEELSVKKCVFFPRAMRPLYDHELAIDSVALLPETIRKEFSFVFVDKNSADKAYTSMIEDKIKQSAADFIWLENLDQKTLFETYKNASLCVMTPKSDGTPVSAVEAMLCKVPLILPPLEYDPDLFAEGVLFFKERTAASLSSLIEAVLKGQILPDIEKAYENALHLADRNKEMNKLGMIYKELNAGK